MKLITFKDYKTYLLAQRNTALRRGAVAYFSAVSIKAAADWLLGELGSPPVKGICHGARNGLECDEFKKHFPQADVMGTDLLPRPELHGGKSKVVKMDFSRQRRGWPGRFDFVYSNSLDHARDPVKTLQVWMQQLTDRGRLLLDWGPSHEAAIRGDNFGASLWEYILLANLVGEVRGLVFTRAKYKRQDILSRRGLQSVVIGAKRR